MPLSLNAPLRIENTFLREFTADKACMGEVRENRVELEAGKRQRNSGARERVGEGEGKGEGGMEERKGKGWTVEDECTVVSMPHKRLTYTYYVVFTE